MNTYELTKDAPVYEAELNFEEDDNILYAAPRKTVVAYGVSASGAPFRVDAPGFPDVTEAEMNEIFSRRPDVNELSANEELAFDLGWDAFLSGRVDDSLEGLKLLGWKAAKEHFEAETDVRREMFSQTVDRF